MTRPKAPPEPIECAAADCEVVFTPTRSTARYHSATCRQRAGRQRKAAEDNAAAEARAQAADQGGDAEHKLVTVTRRDLEKVTGATDTVAGQLALQLARRIANPEESGITTMAKELRVLIAEAKAEAAPPPEPEGPTEPTPPADDQVTAARKRREQIARAAAEAEQ